MPVLPQWDLGIMLEALSKPPYEPLREASLKQMSLYFSPECMRKNQQANQVNDPWYVAAVPTGKSDLGTPNCPVGSLRYYHRYITEHPDLRKGRCRLFVPVNNNNARKVLSAATISRWICMIIVDSPAAFQKSKNIQERSKLMSSGYFVATLQQGRPSGSDEGLKLVHRRHLHVLLPHGPLPAS